MWDVFLSRQLSTSQHHLGFVPSNSRSTSVKATGYQRYRMTTSGSKLFTLDLGLRTLNPVS